MSQLTLCCMFLWVNLKPWKHDKEKKLFRKSCPTSKIDSTAQITPQFDISTILLTLIIWKLPKRGVGSTALPPPSSPDCQSDLENRFYGPNNPQFDISTILLTLIIWKLQKEGWIWKLQKEGWGAPPFPPLHLSWLSIWPRKWILRPKKKPDWYINLFSNSNNMELTKKVISICQNIDITTVLVYA